MDRDTTTTRTETRPPRTDEHPPEEEPNTLMNALIGALVTVITAPLLPVAAIFGGAAAGYLQRGDLGEGAKVGAISGAIAAVPAVLLVWLVAAFFIIGADPLFGFSIVLALVLFFFLGSYLVGAGALGGVLGAYIRKEL